MIPERLLLALELAYLQLLSAGVQVSRPGLVGFNSIQFNLLMCLSIFATLFMWMVMGFMSG